MEIRETLFTKSFSLEADDPYGISLGFMRKLSRRYKIYTRKSTFETDGPKRKSTVIFDVIEAIDQFSQMQINVSLTGENENLYVDIAAYFVLRVKESGFFSEVFTEYYLGSMLPIARRIGDEKAKELRTKIENI